MSKEPRAQAASAPAPSNNQQQQQSRLTPQNFHMFESRVKPLPPSADTSKIPSSTTLFQFRQHVFFRCAHCRLDNIHDDAVAIDSQTGRMTCQKCFARQIRPRSYKPTRLVPFPSLLSWLNFSGGNSSSSQQVGQDGAPLSVDAFAPKIRMAEAVIPSEARARPMGFDGTDGSGNVVGLLTATPVVGLQQTAAATLASMQSNQQFVSGGGDAALPSINNNSASQQQNQTNQVQSSPSPSSFSANHPCPSVFNSSSCTHGSTCFFVRAPGNLCLAYLMGLCEEDSSKRKCNGREHQKVFDLPSSNSVSSTRPERWEVIPLQQQRQQRNDDSAAAADNDEILVAQETQAFKNWVQERKNSKNQPEWQLWNQQNVARVIDQYLPAPKIEQPAEKKKRLEQEAAAASVKKFGSMSASSIESMLKAMKK